MPQTPRSKFTDGTAKQFGDEGAGLEEVGEVSTCPKGPDRS